MKPFYEVISRVSVVWSANLDTEPGIRLRNQSTGSSSHYRKIKDYTLGYKLPGAGGGGYLYMVAKDPQAAGQIRRILTEQAPNPRARFVEMTLSDKGLQVSRS